MILVRSNIQFDNPPPTADAIAAAITRICSLDVTVTPAASGGIEDMYDLNATLAFAADPNVAVELRAYRPGAVRDWYKTHMAGVRMPADTLSRIEGMHEPDGKRIVHLRAFVVQEPTLLVVTELALESLGGCLQEPISDDHRNAYARPLTPADLRRQRRKQAWLGWLLFPFIVLYWLILLVTAPVWLVIAARRMDRNLKKASQRYLFDGDPGYRRPPG